jgi:hypothetical protein
LAAHIGHVVLGVIRQVVNETTDGAAHHVAVLVVAVGVAPSAGDRPNGYTPWDAERRRVRSSAGAMEREKVEKSSPFHFSITGVFNS